MRQYKRDGTKQSAGDACAVIVSLPEGGSVRVEVTREVMEALDDLQREWWRIERREARHVLHLELMSTSMMPADQTDGPEILMLRKQEADEMRRALETLSEKEARRLVLHAVEGVPIKRIAQREGCSERAVKYSLAHARRKLRKLLERTNKGQD